MAEVGILLALAVTGWVLGQSAGWRPDESLAASLPVGAALYLVVMTLLVATGLDVVHPFVGLGLTLVIAAVIGARHASELRTGRPGPRVLTVGVVAIVAMVAVTTLGGFVSASADSFRYLTLAGLLDGMSSVREASLGPLLEKRGLATSALHALARGDHGYLTAVTPLFAASLAWILFAAVRRTGHGASQRVVTLVATGAVLVLLLNERVLFHALYLNSHMLVAAWVLLLQLRVVRLLDGWTPPSPAVDLLATAGLVTAVVTARAEGILLVGVVLLPAILVADVPIPARQRTLVALGLPPVLWHGLVLARIGIARGEDVPVSVLGPLALGFAALLGALVIRQTARFLPAQRPLMWAHAAVWGLLVVLTLRDPGVLYYSARATLRNVLFDGGWGSTLLLLAALLVVVTMLLRYEGDRAIVFTLATFVPMSMLLAFARGGTFRIGPGDSLNRMLMHVLPIAVLAIGASAFGERRAWPPWIRRLREFPTSTTPH